MTPTAPDLASWLLQQIAADEKLANGAGGIGWAVDHGDHKACVGGTGSCSLDPYEACLCRTGECWHCKIIGPNGGTIIFDGGGHDEDDARLIATWNPERVLAECAAKRQAVSWFSDLTTGIPLTFPPETGCLSHLPEWQAMSVTMAADIVQNLAAVYAGRPGYLPEWAPTA